jgi:membrane protease YdiL (CAAX protease family)
MVFSPAEELVQVFTYTIPALALIWYLLVSSSRPALSLARPRCRDLGTVMVALPALLALGALVSLLAVPLEPLLPFPVSAPEIVGPQGPAAFLAMILSCLGVGYLEESYFRLYLSARLKAGGLAPAKALLVSSLLFALCHLYEGPLGALNAFLAGLLLFFIFTRSQSVHGLAWAHGAYNIIAYVMSGMAVGNI